MKMNIARALKEKTRTINKISIIDNLISEENSIDNGSVRSFDLNEKMAERIALTNFLISLKSKIVMANAEIADKLNMMSEFKSLISFYKSINCKEGAFANRYDSSGEKTVFSVIFSKKEIASRIEETQAKINQLQDEIDDFNASKIIDI